MRERTSSTVHFRADVAEAIAARKGLTGVVEKAAFFGQQHPQWLKVIGGVHKPGRDFIAAVLSSPAKEEFPDEVTFDNLFEVA